MSIQKVNSFHVIGIAVRTSNEKGQSGKDIPALWGKFIREDVAAQIPNKKDGIVYCIYTEYEKDHTRPYTTILGCAVTETGNIPDGMVCHTVNEAAYEKFTATGNIIEGAVFNEWTKIWSSGMKRAFTTDFEVYDIRSGNPVNAEVDLFIAI